MRPIARLLTGAVVLVLAGCAGGGDANPDGLLADGAESVPADYAYVIPAGAGEALDRGEPLEVLPAELTVEIGQTIEIVNEDDRGHLLGPFYVGAGETLRQEFVSEGSFIGVCTVHPSGELVLNVIQP